MGLISILLAAIIIAVVSVTVLPKQLGILQPKSNESSSSGQMTPLGVQKSQMQVQLTVMQFMNALRNSAPPINDLESAKTAKAMLTSRARLRISDDPLRISGDLLRFVGIEELPDQGSRIEAVEAIDENTVSVILGLYSSGSGRAARTVTLVFENSSWRIDSVSLTD